MRSDSSLWVVILAGGEGRRLASATRDAAGAHVPKQFCRFGGDASLLSRTLDRARRLADSEHIIVVVQEAHRRWWELELRSLPPDNIIAQAANRGTGVALLHAVATIHARDREACILMLPSDQGVQNEHAWHATLCRAAEAASGAPEHVVLVGAEPQSDPDFGWIVPGERTENGTHTVLGFAEKPGAAEAALLARRGALCSTFVFAASTTTLLDLFGRHASEQIAGYALSVSGSAVGFDGSATVTDDLPYSDFSHDLLERAPERARLVAGEPCGWTDLGTPTRLAGWLGRTEPAKLKLLPAPQPALAVARSSWTRTGRVVRSTRRAGARAARVRA